RSTRTRSSAARRRTPSGPCRPAPRRGNRTDRHSAKGPDTSAVSSEVLVVKQAALRVDRMNDAAVATNELADILPTLSDLLRLATERPYSGAVAGLILIEIQLTGFCRRIEVRLFVAIH